MGGAEEEKEAVGEPAEGRSELLEFQQADPCELPCASGAFFPAGAVVVGGGGVRGSGGVHV